MSSNGYLAVANIGSTSFKFSLYEMPAEKLLARGKAEKIGSAEGPFELKAGSEAAESGNRPFRNYDDAMALAGEFLERKGLPGFGHCAAIGFKPVMAKGISGTQFMKEDVLQAMEAIQTLLPAHNPPYVAAVRAFNKRYPSVPCIGTFETAFYDHVPAANRRFAVPLEWEQKYGITRQGFHGASHRYVSQRVSELRNSGSLRMISCHLGGSSSICAVRDGKAINSSWGMTPQSGLPQNNRIGDFDVFALIYLARDLGLGIDEVEKQLSSQAGLKGMSGLPTGDMRDLREAAAAGNANAATAVEVFVSQIRKYIGQFLVEMNGADVLIFTAGMGENDWALRSKVCAHLDSLGLILDEEKNKKARGTEEIISRPESKIEIRVVPTNEELVIVREAWKKLHSKI